MNKNQLWMVRAGEQAFLIEEFLSKGIVAVGWNAVGDLRNVDSLVKIKKILTVYSEYKPVQINISAG